MTDASSNRATSARDVFVSYASPDAAVANSIVDALEKAGLTCWIAPRDVVPGEFYGGAIVHAIDSARVIVLVLSESAATSQHVLREVERASSKKHPVVSFRTDLAPLPADLEYFINTSHWLDASGIGVDRALPKLVDAVQRAAGLGPAVDRARATGPSGSASLATPRPAPLAKAAARSSHTVIALVALISVALAYFVADRFWLSKHHAAVLNVPAASTAAGEKSIAVLPFTDMSEKHDQEYFADGMAEEILDLLARIPGLTVIGRTSSFQFKGANQDLRAIGARLGASYVLEGSVRRSAAQVRVTAQLIDSRTGTHLWSETYDRPTGDALQVQDQIATGLARALQVSVGADRSQSRRRPKSDQAYELYLRGLHSLGKGDIDGSSTGITYLKQAIEIDPDFTDAGEILSDALYWRANAANVASRVGYEQARQCAESVLQHAPGSALAHAVLGGIHSDYDRDWVAAEREFGQALALAPHDGKVLVISAQLPVALGQLDAARQIYKQALAYDPLSSDSYFFLSWVELRAGNWAEAEAAARKVIEIAPAYEWAHAQVGFALLMQGNRAAALAEVERETDPMIRLEGLALVYHALGRRSDSDAALRALIAGGADREKFQIASVYGYRGEGNEALKWLDLAYEQRDPNLFFIKRNPFLRNLETDVRFKAFLRKMKLPE